MPQVQSRIKKLENQCKLLSRRSLDTLIRQAERMVLQAGVGFEDAANELVRDLTDQELNSIITEVESRYGKEISTSGSGRPEQTTVRI
jgi:hypothetical protein